MRLKIKLALRKWACGAWQQARPGSWRRWIFSAMQVAFVSGEGRLMRMFLTQEEAVLLAAMRMLTTDDLTYSARARCRCGAGLAQVRQTGGFGNWDCSAVLLGVNDNRAVHSTPYLSGSIASERQANTSQRGETTRPGANQVLRNP